MVTLDQQLHTINNSPPGHDTLAVFDFDGTLIAGFSSLFVLRAQFRRGDIDRAGLASTFLALANHQCGLIDDHTLMTQGATPLLGRPVAEFEQLCRQVYNNKLFSRIYPEARSLIAAHQARGHRVIIASSAPAQAIADTAKELGVDTVLSSHYLSEGGYFTGEVAMPVCWGYGKRLAVEEHAHHCGASLANSFFYSDSDDDLPLLEQVGRPVALNPNKRLQAVASQRQWPQLAFTSRRRGVTEVARSLGVYASLIGSYLGGLSIARLSGDRVQGRQFMVSTFTDTVCAMIGLKIDLINGHYLKNSPPAVVIFNHQSQADGFIIMKLLGDNFAGIGKKAFGKIPLLSDAYAFAGIIPIDRNNGKGAIESMRPLVDAIRLEGRSVAIAPEGTRSSSRCPGPFKKGAFHLAIDASVNIIPVVIHNAADVQAKGDALFHPGTVKVEILPPVETQGWQRADLDRYIAQVHGQYLDALGCRKPKPVRKRRRKGVTDETA